MCSSPAYTSFKAPIEPGWPRFDHSISCPVQMGADVEDQGVDPTQADFAAVTPMEGGVQRTWHRLVRPSSNTQRLAVVAASPELRWQPEEMSSDANKERRSNVGNFQRVLVAEHHKATRSMLIQMLRKWGFEAVSARSGMEVLQIVEQDRPPELIMLSRMLPGIDTVELCRRISGYRSEYTPYILVLAMQNDRGEIVRALESGAAEYLTTPFEAKELRARLIVATRILQRQESLITSRDQFRALATKDGLTGIWNRRSIQEILEDELDRAACSDRSTGVLLVDLDHFKRVNDTHGHLAGDLVLQETSRRLKNALRIYDSLGRYGGEEFLIVVPGSLEEELCELAERMRAIIEREPIFIGETEVRITLSIGAAIVPPRGKLPASVLAVADQALYDAKKLGRNCICMRGLTTRSIPPASCGSR